MRLAASDLADWWDEQHKISKKALEDFVDAYPDWWAVAAVGATFMDVGAGMVDVLRLGEGAGEAMEADSALGVIKGVGKDFLRAVQIIGPVGRVAGKVVRLAAKPGYFLAARYLSDPGGGICTWMSAAKALRQVGVRAFVTVDDLAKGMGLELAARELPSVWVTKLIDVLKTFGAKVTNLGKPASWSDVVNATKGNGVILFSVKWMKKLAGGGEKPVGHTLIAFRDAFGRFRISDRTGNVVGSLEELGKKVTGYGDIGGATVGGYGEMAEVAGPLTGELTRIEGVLMKIMPSGLSTMAMEVLSKFTQVDSETAAQTFVMRQMHLDEVPPPPAARFHVVVKGDWLSKLAKRYYKNMHKWPIIFEANRKTIGSNPDLIEVGQKLLIPELPQIRGKKG